jgi:hypothetical protein
MKLFLKLLAGGFFIVTLFQVATTPTLAAQPLDITTSPSLFQLNAKPGDALHQKIRMRNNTNSPIPMTATTKKLMSDTHGKVDIQDFKKEDTTQSWISFDSTNFVANPKEWTDIPFTISIPKDAAFGYYFAIFISPANNIINAKTSQAQITGAVAVPILLFVQKDGAITAGKLNSFITTNNAYEYLPVIFLTDFTNLGNVHVRPQGNIFITDWRGKQVATLAVNKEQGNVLPNSKRIFQTMWDDSFITEDNKRQLAFHFDKLLHLRIGKYTAHEILVISGEKNDIPFEATTTFWVFPWKIVLGAIFFVLLALIGLINIIHGTTKMVKKVIKR